MHVLPFHWEATRNWAFSTKLMPLRIPQINHSAGERILQGKFLPFSTSPVKEILKKKGDIRVVVFDNGQKKTLTKQELKGLVVGAIAQEQLQKAKNSLRPTPPGSQFKLTGFIKGVRRAFRSREHAVELMEEAYGVGQVRGTRFSKASKFGTAREAVRSMLKARQMPARYVSHSA